jgi:hypothetical protein
MAASHEAQFTVYALRQAVQSRFVAAAPGLQQSRDFSRGSADGQPVLPHAIKKIYQNVAAFAAPFRLYQRKEIVLSRMLFQQTGDTYETQRNYGTAAALESSFCYDSLRRRVLSTGAGANRGAFDPADRHSRPRSIF